MFWFYLHEITVIREIKYTQSADYPFRDIAAYIFQHFQSIIVMCTVGLWWGDHCRFMVGSLRYHQASNQHIRQCQQRSAPFRMTQCPGSLLTSQRFLAYRLYRTCLVGIHSVHLCSVLKILPQDKQPNSHPELQNTIKPAIHQHIGDTKPDTTPNIAEDKSESTPNSRKDNI